MIRYVWLNKPWIFIALSPVKFTAVYDHTTDRCAMSANEFCCGMYNDICAILDRAHQIRGCKCIIHDQRNIVGMCDVCDSFNINNF